MEHATGKEEDAVNMTEVLYEHLMKFFDIQAKEDHPDALKFRSLLRSVAESWHETRVVEDMDPIWRQPKWSQKDLETAHRDIDLNDLRDAHAMLYNEDLFWFYIFVFALIVWAVGWALRQRFLRYSPELGRKCRVLWENAPPSWYWHFYTHFTADHVSVGRKKISYIIDGFLFLVWAILMLFVVQPCLYLQGS